MTYENKRENDMERRDFLKVAAGLMASVVAIPSRLFVPPRKPFVRHSSGLDGLYSHLGVLPSTNELNICEGVLLEIGNWDGTGFPCLVQNACTFGREPPRVWIYDFDLWNFRHDDVGPMWEHSVGRRFPSHAAWYAHRRFGTDLRSVVIAGQGAIARQLFGGPLLDRRYTSARQAR